MNRRRFTASILAAAALPRLASAQTPTASPEAASGLRRFDAPGLPLTLSPDGTLLAGLAEDGAICVWDAESFAVVTRANEVPEVPITQRSLAWAPDSSAVAFSLEAAILIKDSDIFVLGVDTDEVVNLTDDDPDKTGADEISISDPQGTNVPVDGFPAWSPDSQHLIFTRTIWGQDPTHTMLMTIPRAGGEPEERYTLEQEGPMLVYSPMRWLEDGSVLFGVWMPQIDNPGNGIWRLSPEGEANHVVSGHPEDGIPGVEIVDISPDGTRASAYSSFALQQFTSEAERIWFEVSLEDGSISPWVNVLGMDADPADALSSGGPGLLIAPPVYTPDGGVIFMTRDQDQTVHLSRSEPGREAAHLLEIEGDGKALPGDRIGPRIELAANGTLLARSGNGVVLVPLADTGATPVT